MKINNDILLNNWFLIFVISLIISNKITSQELATGASSVNDKSTFSVGSNTTSSMSNSVNLSTGSVNLPIHIVSMNANNRTPVKFSIIYNSQIALDKANRWNKEGATGVLGLGWSFSLPKILVDNKGTGTRIDDDFYFENVRLIYTGSTLTNGKTIFNYVLQNMLQWKFAFTEVDEKWELTKDDGTKIIFGDKSSNEGNAIEWIWKWGNWIGSSRETIGLGKQAIAWNINYQEDREGNKVYYTYQKVERYLGNVSYKNYQTEASYLRRIQDDLGRRIMFNYNEKTSEEYIEENTQIVESGDFGEGDAYQERIQKKYLESIELASSKNKLIKKVKFEYTFRGIMKSKKRLLTSIVNYNYEGKASPSTNFVYVDDDSVYDFLLKSVTSPEGSSIVYNYQIKHKYIEDFVIDSPNSSYKQPLYWYGEDYIIVAWRNPSTKTVKVFRYQWNGIEYLKSELETIYDVNLQSEPEFSYYTKSYQRIYDYKDFAVLIGSDYFIIKKQKSINIYYKDKPNDRYSWSRNSFSLYRNDWKIHLGNSFIVTTYEKTSGYTGYRIIKQNGKFNSWVSEDMVFSENGYYREAVGKSHFITHNRYKDPDIMHVFYLDRSNKWVKKQFTPNLVPNTLKGNPSLLYSNNTSLLSMFNGIDDYIFTWDENYENVKRSTSIKGIGYASRVNSNSALFGLSDLDVYYYGSTDDKDEMMLRGFMKKYNGNTWKTEGYQVFGYKKHYSTSFSNNLFIVYGGAKEYYHGNENSLYNKIGVKYYNANTNWQLANLFTSDKNYTVEVGYNFFVNYNKLFYLDNGIIKESQIKTFLGSDISKDKSLVSGTNGYDKVVINYNGVWALSHYINGGFKTKHISSSDSHNDNTIWMPYNPISGNILITGAHSNSTQLTLHKFSNKSLDYSYKTAVVSSIEIQNTTTDKQYVHFEYSNPASDYSGSSVLFNKVRQSKSPTSTISYNKGYTDYYFANGQRKEYLLLPEGYYSYSQIPSKGGMYASVVYNSNGNIELSNYNKFLSITDYVKINNKITGKLYTQVLYKTIKRQSYADEVITNYKYNSYGILKSRLLEKETIIKKDGTNNEYYKEKYSYLNDYYDFAENENYKSTIVATQSSKKVGNNYKLLNANATIWEKGSNDNYYPTITYARKIDRNNASGTSDLYSELLNSSENWIQTQSLVYDSYGNVIEQHNVNTGFVKTNYLKNGNKLLANVNGAKYSEVFFENFEDESNNEWTNNNLEYDNTKSFTGQTCGKVHHNTNGGDTYAHSNKWLDVKLSKSKKYKYSGWFYSDNPRADLYLFMNKNNETRYYTDIDYVLSEEKNKWTYLEGIVEVPATIDKINLRVGAALRNGNVWYDDLRLYPADADMTTYTSNEQQGVTSVSSELGRVTKNIFNEKGELEFVVDEKDNVLEQNKKNLKRETVTNSPSLTEINIISKTSIGFSSAVGSTHVLINTNGTWTATVTTGSSWITIEELNNNPDGVLIVSVGALSCGSGNKTGKISIEFNRNGQIVTENISVYQSAYTESCPQGKYWDSTSCNCISIEEDPSGHDCPAGKEWDEDAGKCMPKYLYNN